MSHATRLSFVQYLHYAITFALMFGFRYLPPVEPLTEVSMQVIGVFAGVIYAWITISIGWPSVLGVVAFGLTDYISMTDLFPVAFGSQTMVMILMLLMLAAFVQQADLTDFILNTMLGRKEARGKPYLMLFYFLYAGFLASILSNCLAVLIIFLELFKQMRTRIGIEPYSPAIPCFFVGMAWAFILGDIAVPFKSTSILSIATYEAITGTSMNLVSYTLFMFPMTTLCIIFYVLCCKYIFRIDLSALTTYTHSGSVTLSPRQRASLIGVLGAMVMLLVPSILPDSWTISFFFKSIGLGGLSLLLLSILLIVRVEGEPIMDMRRIAGQFPWEIFFIMVFLMPLANALASDEIAIKPLLANATISIFQTLPTLLIIFAMVLIPALITNFANNVIICVIFVSVIGTIGASLPFDPVILSCLVIMGANISCFFPAANPMNAILFAQKELVTFRQEFQLGLCTLLLQSLFIAVVGYAWGIVCF